LLSYSNWRTVSQGRLSYLLKSPLPENTQVWVVASKLYPVWSILATETDRPVGI